MRQVPGPTNCAYTHTRNVSLGVLKLDWAIAQPAVGLLGLCCWPISESAATAAVTQALVKFAFPAAVQSAGNCRC